MPTSLPFILAGLLVIALLIWSVAAQRRRHRATQAASERLGLRPCVDQKSWLEETVTALGHNRGFRYEVRDPGG